MSVEIYLLLPVPFNSLTPSLLGLGEGLFPWPDAQKHGGWSYPDAGIEFDLLKASQISKSFDLKAVCPGKVSSAIRYMPYWYKPDMEWTFASALGGLMVTDAVMHSGLYDSEDEGEFADPDGGKSEAEARGLVLEKGYKGKHLAADQWKKPNPQCAMLARAMLYADRFRPDPARFAMVRDRATGGDAEATEVLRLWAERATYKSYSSNQSRKDDLNFFKSGMTPPLKKLLEDAEIPELKGIL